MPPTRRDEVTADIAQLLAGTGLAGAEIVETSTETGEGIEKLRDILFAASRETAARDAAGRFRLAIDRCFTLRGVGTVVTGTVLSGAVSVGDTVTISPSGLVGARAFDPCAESAGRSAAWRASAAPSTSPATASPRMRSRAATWRSTRRCTRRRSASTRSCACCRARRSRCGSRFGCITARRRLARASCRWARTGCSSCSIGRLPPPSGDRFVLRDHSARRTIGGGVFVDLRAPARRRRTPERLARLEALASDDVDRGAGFAARSFSISTRWRRDRALPAEDDGSPAWVRLGNHVVSRETWAAFAASLHAALAAFHAANPDAAGAAPDTLRRVVEPRFPAPLFAAALAELARQGIVAMAGGLVRAARSRRAPQRGTTSAVAKI